MTTRLLAHEAIGFAGTLTLALSDGETRDITAWTFAAALGRVAGTPDVTLGMAADESAEGFRVVDGPGMVVTLRILQATLAGIADTTGQFALTGDLMATLPDASGQYIDTLQMTVVGDGVTPAGEDAGSDGLYRVEVAGLPGASYADVARRLGVSHAEVGAYLLGVWGLPFSVIEAVAYHHRPSAVEAGDREVIAAVHVADTIVEAGDSADPGATTGLDVAFLDASGWAAAVPKAREWTATARAARLSTAGRCPFSASAPGPWLPPQPAASSARPAAHPPNAPILASSTVRSIS